jgi:hypothetical protein
VTGKGLPAAEGRSDLLVFLDRPSGRLADRRTHGVAGVAGVPGDEGGPGIDALGEQDPGGIEQRLPAMQSRRPSRLVTNFAKQPLSFAVAARCGPQQRRSPNVRILVGAAADALFRISFLESQPKCYPEQILWLQTLLCIWPCIPASIVALHWRTCRTNKAWWR